MSSALNIDAMTLGTCYYPEHWDESMWREDLRRMLECGIEVIRIAEFAWSKIELREGEFDFSFFDRFLDLALEEGMKVIFCTPTATPPAWLTEKYPETLNADIDGNLYRHGARRHYNYNSPKYQELCARITEQSAAHYAPHKAIIGWQIDNEINCEKDEFYSKSDDEAFRHFLVNKYGTVDALNEAWGTVFWNQTYTSFDEVHIPQKTLSSNTNPHRVLDYIRFVSDSACRFARLQSDILRRYIKPGDFITTNGMFGHLDNHRMTGESLDFLTYDTYPNFAYLVTIYDPAEDALRDRAWSRNLADVRAVSPVFGIMEQQSGANGWSNGMCAGTPRPGQMLLWTMQSVANGADYVSYFRWRTCRFGTEIYWHGILDYSGRDTRRLAEVRSAHALFEKLTAAGLTGARCEAQIAYVKDYDNIWDSQVDAWHNRIEWPSQMAWFKACQHTHTPMDFLYLRMQPDIEAAGETAEDAADADRRDPENAAHYTTVEDLLKYQVLVYAHPLIMTRERAALLEEYVRRGGTLILGCRSGQKDMNGICVSEKLPGLLRGVSGADIPEYTMVPPDEKHAVIDWDGVKLEAALFNDQLGISDSDRAAGVPEAETSARVLGRYEGIYYAGAPGLTVNELGDGKCYYYGAAFTEESAKVFLEKLGAAEPYAGYVEAPACTEIEVRKNGAGKRFLFVLNYSPDAVTVQVKQPMENVGSGETVQGELALGGYGVAVLAF